jgi:hypothetical protein
MATPQTTGAPTLLKLVGWVTILLGILQMITGALLIVYREDISDDVIAYSTNEVTGFGIAAIVVGLIYVLIGRGFLSLNSFALLLGFIFSGLSIVGDIGFMVTNEANHGAVLGSLIVNVIVFVAVCLGFGARSASPDSA